MGAYVWVEFRYGETCSETVVGGSKGASERENEVGCGIQGREEVLAKGGFGPQVCYLGGLNDIEM